MNNYFELFVLALEEAGFAVTRDRDDLGDFTLVVFPKGKGSIILRDEDFD